MPELPELLRCHARLTQWESRSKIGSSKFCALKVFVCNLVPTKGLLCEVCSQRSRDTPRHSPRLHGLLTEPIPEDSHIYGSAWYWKQVAKFGDPPAEWVESAKEQQRLADLWIEAKPKLRVDTMPPKKKQEPKASPQIFPREAFLLYKESDKPAMKLLTDSYTIKKEVYNGVPVWVLPNGVRFDMNEKGEPMNILSEG
jgi:hypothetical protein